MEIGMDKFIIPNLTTLHVKYSREAYKITKMQPETYNCLDVAIPFYASPDSTKCVYIHLKF